MVAGLLGNESSDSNRFTLVTPKSENDVRLQATLGNQNPTGLPVGVVRHSVDIYIFIVADCIISNPPFTNKRKIFERALSFNKPFALIMSNTWLNDSAPKQLFKDKDLQLLMFDKRMKFENNGEVNNKITFSSSYFCFNILPKQIIMEKLEIE